VPLFWLVVPFVKFYTQVPKSTSGISGLGQVSKQLYLKKKRLTGHEVQFVVKIEHDAQVELHGRQL
jgi:hypothetical protein